MTDPHDIIIRREFRDSLRYEDPGRIHSRAFIQGLIVGAIVGVGIFVVVQNGREPTWDERRQDAQSFACSLYPTCVRRAEGMLGISSAPIAPARYVRSPEIEKILGPNPFTSGEDSGASLRRLFPQHFADDAAVKHSRMSDKQFEEALAAADRAAEAAAKKRERNMGEGRKDGEAN